MISSISNNQSALRAFGTGLEVKANNIANSNSDNFKKSRAVNLEGDDGGVKVEIRKVDDENQAPSINPEVSNSDPALSNADLAEEIPGMAVDQIGYQANLKAIETQEEMLGSVMDIIA